ncbi:hypothetical protein NFI96_010963, partial [Prochilodus magdalenae]
HAENSSAVSEQRNKATVEKRV